MPDAPLLLITGISGYFASVLAAYALAAGYRVRGTVRRVGDPKTDPKTAGLLRLTGPHAPVELIAADFSSPDGWADAVKGVTYVLHTASPVPTDRVRDAEKEVVGPAVSGVLLVLEAAAKEGSVKRVVLTGSTAAVNEGRYAEWKAGKVFDESDWSDESKCGPYPLSKTRAEKAAWNFMMTHPATGFDLCVLNPAFIIGPCPSDTPGSSATLFRRLLNREMPGVPDLIFWSIDVRDVALAHLRAMLRPEAGGKRIILANESRSMKQIAMDLAAEFGKHGYSVPTGTIPSWILRLASHFDGALAIVAPVLGLTLKMSTARAEELLGMRWLDLRKASTDAAHCFIAKGLIGTGKPPIKAGEVMVASENWRSFAPAPAGSPLEVRRRYAFAMDDIEDVVWKA
ncbi:oxidoreductase [Hyaloraphidium curvatum]|nr:oxidoreductase [Hyaloraphidium curvatum]